MIDIETQVRLVRWRVDQLLANGHIEKEDLPWDVQEVEFLLRNPSQNPSFSVPHGQPWTRLNHASWAVHWLKGAADDIKDESEFLLAVYALVDLDARRDLANDDPVYEKWVRTNFIFKPWPRRTLALLQLRLFTVAKVLPRDAGECLQQFQADFEDAQIAELAEVESWEPLIANLLHENWGHGCSVLQLLRLRYGAAFTREVEHTAAFGALNRLWHAVLWKSDPLAACQLPRLIEFHASGAKGLLHVGARDFKCDPIADRAREFDDLADDVSREQARVMLERRARYEAKLAAEAYRKSQPLPALPPEWVGADGALLTKLYAGNFPVFFGMGTIEPEGMENEGNHFASQVNGMLGTAVAPLLQFNTGLHTGKVHLSVWLADEEPPLPDAAWDELVEAPYLVPPGSKLCLRDWEGAMARRLRLPPGSYRVRMGAARMMQGQDWPDARDKRQRPIERYALVFWPAPPRPDAVLREACGYARDIHEQTSDESAKARRAAAADASQG